MPNCQFSFSHFGLWSGNFLLIASFLDHCLLVLFYIKVGLRKKNTLNSTCRKLSGFILQAITKLIICTHSALEDNDDESNI